MNKNIVTKARNLMQQQTKKNGAPSWALTEIAVQQGKYLANKYKADENLVLTSLYLAHTIFSTKIKGSIQKNHENLSAEFAKKYLKKWQVSENDTNIIINAILCHHDRYKPTSLEAEVMKNAECFKFLTIEGIIVFIHHLGNRGLSLEEAIKFAKAKASQKLRYISLPSVKASAKKSYNETVALLNSLTAVL